MGSNIRDWFARLVDDAAWFPPGNLPLESAVPAHDAHRHSPRAFLVGPFLIPDTELPELARLVVRRDDPLPVHIVVSGGAGALGPALTYAGRVEGLDVRAVETAVRDDDPAYGVRRAAAMVAESWSAELDVWLELPPIEADWPTSGWLTALDEVAACGYGCKYRTGGLDASAFPTERQLAAVIDAALDRELAVKFTAGLHRAIRHCADDGFEHHGFINVLLAFDRAREGGNVDEVAGVLGTTDSELLVECLRARANAASSVRRTFTSFGSCSIDEPFEDLCALGLIGEGGN